MRRSGSHPRAASRARFLGLLLTAVMGISSVGVSAASATVGQQEQEVQRVVAEIAREHERIDQLVEQYVQALDQKAALDVQIAASMTKIAAQQTELSAVQSQLGNVAVQKFIEGDNGGLGPLFSNPADIGDGLQKDQLTRVALNAGSATTDDYEQLLKDFNEERAKLESAQAAVAAVAATADKKRAEAEDATAALEVRLAQEKAKLGDLIDQEEQRQVAAAAAQYQRDVAQRQAQLAAAAAQNGANNGGGNNGGGNSSTGGGNAGGGDQGGTGAGNSGGGSSSGGGNADPGVGAPPPVSGKSGIAVQAALAQLGVSYRYASSSPGVAFDCSGLTAYAWGQAGVGLPHQSGQQYASIPHIAKTDAQAGDLIFYYSPIGHVGLYLGNGTMVHAPATGDVVKISSVNWNKVVGVGRPG